MDIHRAGATGDWETIPPKRHNRWQRVAAKTHGVITPANGVSLFGGGLGVIGLAYIANGQGRVGVTLLIIGRLADIADGTVAQATGTKSPVGEAVDATIDKIMCAGVLLVFALESWLPLWIVVLLAGHTIINSLLGLVGNARRLGIHPTRTGKIGAALVWIALISFGVTHLTNGTLHALLHALSYASAVVALTLSYASSLQYGKAVIAGLRHNGRSFKRSK